MNIQENNFDILIVQQNKETNQDRNITWTSLVEMIIIINRLEICLWLQHVCTAYTALL